MDAELFERWFAIADQDHDGVVSGAEAVEFFVRSTLSQETLFQVPPYSTTTEAHRKGVSRCLKRACVPAENFTTTTVLMSTGSASIVAISHLHHVSHLPIYPA